MGTKVIVGMASLTLASVFGQKLLMSAGETDKAQILNICTMGGLIATAASAVVAGIKAISSF